jgi:hypothetical protein
MERRRIIINFKNTPEDIALYEAVKKHSSISGYIKDILKGLVKEQPTTEQKRISKKMNDIDNDINDILGGL